MASIQQMQEEMMAKGFVFREETFPNGDSYLNYKRTSEVNPYLKNSRGFLMGSDGWLHCGRFPREQAWKMVYEALKEKGQL